MPSAPITTSASLVAPFSNDHPRDVAFLREARHTVAGKHYALRQPLRQELDEVGAVHAEGGIPAGSVRHLHRRDRRPVVAEILRTGADPRAVLLDRCAQAYALQMPHAVRGDEHAGADFAQFGRLLVDARLKPLRDQRIGGEQAGDTPAHDDDAWPPVRHDRFLPPHLQFNPASQVVVAGTRMMMAMRTRSDKKNGTMPRKVSVIGTSLAIELMT